MRSYEGSRVRSDGEVEGGGEPGRAPATDDEPAAAGTASGPARGGPVTPPPNPSSPAPATPEPGRAGERSVLTLMNDDPNALVEFPPLDDGDGRL